MILVEEKLFNLLQKTSSDTPRLAARADFIIPKYIGISKKGIYHFRTNSQTSPGNYWYQTIELKNLLALATSASAVTPELLSKWFEVSDVNIFCSCPAYSYWAFQFMGTQRDYNDPEQPETRMPTRNNTKLRGGLCKHITAIAEEIQSGSLYEQMSKDTLNWIAYKDAKAYKSFNRGRLMGQFNKRDKEIDWKQVDNFVTKALWAKHSFAKFLRQNNVKKSIQDEINRLQQSGERLSLDDFLETEFGMSLQDLSRQIGVEEKDLDDYFKQTYGITNTGDNVKLN